VPENALVAKKCAAPLEDEVSALAPLAIANVKVKTYQSIMYS
jgi:hypothetical protein